ncbi:hypothetical protein HMPREF1249_1627 [Jonquetella sp. BV3C21]|nr:hypothetical protein HMPREF1249_1627 [Jonquetella sp. BV3C21]
MPAGRPGIASRFAPERELRRFLSAKKTEKRKRLKREND